MKRWVPAVALVVLLGLTALFWIGTGERPVEKPTKAVVPKRPPPTRTVYHFEPPERAVPTEAPAPVEPAEPGAPSAPMNREVMNGFAAASNEATGRMWHECVRPWRDDHEPIDAPLTVNLVLQDGWVGDVEIIAPVPLPPDLLSCMEDRMWSVEFPEFPGQRGELRLQRTLELKR